MSHQFIRFSQTSDKNSFIEQFSRAALECREEKFHIGQLPPEAVKMFFALNYPAPHDFWLIQNNEGTLIATICANVCASSPTRGFLGFFECRHDEESMNACKTMIKEAESFLKSNGVQNVFAPVNFNTWFPYRFQSTSDERLFSFEPVNPSFYCDIFKDLEFNVSDRYISRAMPSLDYRLDAFEASYNKATQNGFTFKSFADIEDIDTLIQYLYQVSVKGFADNHLYEPISFDVFKMIYVSGMNSYDYSYSYMAFNENNEPVGFFFIFPYQEYLVLKSVAVLPEARGKGVSNGFVYLSQKKGMKTGLKKTLAALFKDDAQSNSYSKGEFSWEHEYVLLSKSIF